MNESLYSSDQWAREGDLIREAGIREQIRILELKIEEFGADEGDLEALNELKNQ